MKDEITNVNNRERWVKCNKNGWILKFTCINTCRGECTTREAQNAMDRRKNGGWEGTM